MRRHAGLSGWTRRLRVGMALCGLILASQAAPVVLAAEDYAGSAVCAGCHEAEAKAWKSSQHAHAMQDATEATVRGDFTAPKPRTSAPRRASPARMRFFVATEGKDGKQAEFPVKYTFGVDPLQQFLVEFPDGRLQALPYAWDTRPKAEGGSAGFICIRPKIFHRRIRSTGPGRSRTGTICVRSATPPTCTRITMQRKTASKPRFPR